MRIPAKFFVSFTLFAAFAVPLPGFAYSFASNLGLGSSGIDVVALQQTLNSSPDTAVASSGPGSPGQETAYFGALTLDAVNRFQAKYRAEILTPNGLTAPTGLVGPSTRAQLELVSTPINTPVSTSVPSYTPTQALSAPVSTVTASNIATAGTVTLPPMAERIELYIADIKKGLEERGESKDTIALVEKEVRRIGPQAESTLEKFYKQEQDFFKKSRAQADGPVVAFVKSSLSAIGTFFVGETARAALGLPFGGYVATVIPVCTCTPAITQMFVFLPQVHLTTNLTLDYAFGTQAFNWHTLPLPGVATLGAYAPVTPTCFIYVGAACVPIPSRGLITPVVGSSLVPL